MENGLFLEVMSFDFYLLSVEYVDSLSFLHAYIIFICNVSTGRTFLTVAPFFNFF